MKLLMILLVLVVVVVVECGHTFIGTNTLRPLVYHREFEYDYKSYKKRVKNCFYEIPSNEERVIEGILAFDLTYSGATANVTQGGVGYNFVNVLLKSDTGKRMHFKVYIYA